MALDRKTRAKIRKAGVRGTLNGYPKSEWLEAILHAASKSGSLKPLHLSGSRRLMDAGTEDAKADTDETSLSLRCMLRNVEESRVRQLTRALHWSVVSHWRYCGPGQKPRRRDKILFRCADIWNLFDRLATIDGKFKPNLFRSFISRNVVQVGDGYAALHPGVGGRLFVTGQLLGGGAVSAGRVAVARSVSEERDHAGRPALAVVSFCETGESWSIYDWEKFQSGLVTVDWPPGGGPPKEPSIDDLFRFTEGEEA